MKLKLPLLALAATLQINAQNLQWAKGFGGTFDEESAAIAVDASGNVYTAGFFWNTVDFDPGPGTFTITSEGNTDIFVQKLDASGNFVWAVAMGSVADDHASDIAVDGSGNVYITGMFSTLCDFDPGPGSFQIITSSGSYDAFVEKLNSNGDMVWAKGMGGSSTEEGLGIFVDGSSNVYTTGRFGGSGDFDPGSGTTTLTSAGGSDVFVQKLSGAGAFAWAVGFGGATTDEGNDITVDASGNVITTGYFQTICDFDPGLTTSNLTSSGLKDVFVSKLNSSGSFVWAKNIGGATDDIGNSLAADASGNIYLTGTFSGIADMDPGSGTSNLTSNGLDDIFVLMLSGTGSFGWSAQMGGTSIDKGVDIYANFSEVYITGEFSGTIDFDPGSGTANLNSSSGGIFIQKLTTAGAYTWAVNYSGSNVFGCTLDASGIVYTTGIFGGTSDMDPGAGVVNLTASGNTDIYVHKMDQLPVGIQEADLAGEMIFYPNPSQGELFLLSPKNENFYIIIYDPLGKQVLREKSGESLTQLDLRGLNNGMYIVELRREEKTFKKKLILTK